MARADQLLAAHETARDTCIDFRGCAVVNGNELRRIVGKLTAGNEPVLRNRNLAFRFRSARGAADQTSCDQ